MKIYISSDMEGTGGICLFDQVIKLGKLYEEAAELMIEELNAAVESASECGADTIYVRDYHWTDFNFPVSKLSDKAQYIMGSSVYHQPVKYPYLDGSFDGMILIGYHAMAGTKGAVLDHTYSPDSIRKCTINGMEFGEIAMDGLVAGAFGVPVILVTGCDMACLEAEKTFGKVCTAETKKSLGRQSACFKAPTACRKLIKEKVKEAVGNIGLYEPYKIEPPYCIDKEFFEKVEVKPVNADGVKIEQVGPCTVRYEGEDILKLMSKLF